MGTNIRGTRIKLVCPRYEWCFCRLGPWNFKFLILFHFSVVKSKSIAVTSGSFHGPPYEKQHIASIEAVQRTALRFVTGDCSRYSSVTQMREALGWETLECRRHLATATNFTSQSTTSSTSPSLAPSDLLILDTSPPTPMPTSTPSSLAQSLYGTICLATTAVTATSAEAFQVCALLIIRTFCHPNWPMKPYF